MRAVAYARVSSAGQRDRDTIASQLRVLPAFIGRMEWTLVRPIDTYIDDGRTAKSGHLDARLGLAKLLADAAAGVFDVVVVVDLDRLTRAEDLTERGHILGAFQRAGVKIASATSGQILDLSTSIGDLFGTLQAFFAAEENRKRRERTVQGKLTAIQRSRKPSGPTPYGLAYDRETGAWSVDIERGPVVIEMFERVAAGESCMSICEDFHRRGIPRPRGTWSRHRVWSLVRSRHAVGEWTVDKKRKLTITVPPIVTEDLWQRAQVALLRHKKRGLRRTKHIYLLEGLARCGACGSPMLVRSATGAIKPSTGERYHPAAYVCRQRKLDLRDTERCEATIITVADADARVWASLSKLIQTPALIEAALEQRRDRVDDPHDWRADADEYRRRIALLDRSETLLLQRLSRGTVSETALDLELDRLGRERTALREQLKFAEGAALQATTHRGLVDDAKSILRRMAAVLPNASLQARRELVVMFLPPGSVTFQGREIQLLAEPPVAATSRASGAVAVSLADTSGWDVHHESDRFEPLRIRLVA